MTELTLQVDNDPTVPGKLHSHPLVETVPRRAKMDIKNNIPPSYSHNLDMIIKMFRYDN